MKRNNNPEAKNLLKTLAKPLQCCILVVRQTLVKPYGISKNYITYIRAAGGRTIWFQCLSLLTASGFFIAHIARISSLQNSSDK